MSTFFGTVLTLLAPVALLGSIAVVGVYTNFLSNRKAEVDQELLRGSVLDPDNHPSYD